MQEQECPTPFKDFVRWLFLCDRSVVRKPFFRFAGQSFAAIFSQRDSSKAPVPKLVLRIGVAGHIDLPEGPALIPLIDDGLGKVRQALLDVRDQYRAALQTQEIPGVECRLICQLAAGADQLVADRAEKLGYLLQCPLPMDLESYAEDLRRNPGVDEDPVGGLHRLAQKATVLQFDGKTDADPNQVSNAKELAELTYENSALTMLEHSDVLLAIVRSDAGPEPGGTRWLVNEAERRGMPVIELDPADPLKGRLWQGPPENRSEEILTGTGWVSELVRDLILPPPDAKPLPASGCFEEKFRTRVQPNESEWPPNWEAARKASRTEPQVQAWVDAVQRDYFPFWRWAEHRANAYRNLYQGAYVAVAGLALMAVFGAALGAFRAGLSTPGKLLEILVLMTALALWIGASRGCWRQRWLSYRLIEQQINNAALLELVGRTVPTRTAPSLHEFQKEGAWGQWYLRAVLRQANLPALKLDQLSLVAAGKLILTGKIGRQIDYYHSASDLYCRAHHRLEMISFGILCVTLISAVAYVAVHLVPGNEAVVHAFRDLAMATGLLGPALVASLAAVRAQGEFVQLETRYRGMKRHLEDLQGRLSATLKKARTGGPMPLLSWQLARYSQEAVGRMLDEVSQWRSLLHTKEIEL